MKKHKQNDEGSFMGMLFCLEKKAPTRTRRIPLLPRVGLYIDMAGYELVFKKVPLLESLVNLVEKGASWRALRDMTRQQLAEIDFPKIRSFRVVDTSARTISAQVD